MEKEVKEEVKEIKEPYLRLDNPTDEQVNNAIRDGYTPWQITPMVEIVKRNAVVLTESTNLVFHFLRRATK